MLAGWIGLLVTASLPLPAGETFAPPWEPLVFLPAGSPLKPAEVARFALLDEPEVGRVLAIGPWLAGQWSARVQYRTPFPPQPVELSGRYRTVDLSLGAPSIRYECYDAEGRRLSQISQTLLPSATWRPFRLRLDRFPGGTAGCQVAFGLSQRTTGQVRFAALALEPAGPHPLADLPEPPLTRQAPPATLAATGRWRVEQAGGAWWLVDPAGRPSYSLATDPPTPGDEAAAERYVEQLRAWGFNGLAGWHSLERYARHNAARRAAGRPTVGQFPVVGFHDCQRYGTHDYLTDRRGNRKEGEHGFPDPFDPRWVEAARRKIAARVAVVGDAPEVVAWFVDNEISFDELYRYVWSPATATAFLAFLQTRYPTLAELNTRWNTRYADWPALAADKPEPLLIRGAQYDDFKAFERVLVQRYVETTARLVREADPGRLVASNRHHFSGVETWLPLLDLCAVYDLVALNYYPPNLEPGLGEVARELVREVHRRSGRPVLIGEWSVPALDSGLYERRRAVLDWSFPQAVPTQRERAAQAAWITTEWFNEPAVVGAHWFIWRDYDSDQREANRGLVKADGTPWPELTAALTAVHRRLAARLGG